MSKVAYSQPKLPTYVKDGIRYEAKKYGENFYDINGNIFSDTSKLSGYEDYVKAQKKAATQANEENKNKLFASFDDLISNREWWIQHYKKQFAIAKNSSITNSELAFNETKDYTKFLNNRKYKDLTGRDKSIANKHLSNISMYKNKASTSNWDMNYYSSAIVNEYSSKNIFEMQKIFAEKLLS